MYEVCEGEMFYVWKIILSPDRILRLSSHLFIVTIIFYQSYNDILMALLFSPLPLDINSYNIATCII